jgi:UDP-perosamine 4-acetyltransferase
MSSNNSSPDLAKGALPVVFVGAGGHAAVCLDVFESSGREVLGYVAPESSKLPIPHLGSDDTLATLLTPEIEAFVAIGNNEVRLRLVRELLGMGISLATATSASATISMSARLGRGTVVMPGAVVNARASLGDGVILNTLASVDHDGNIHDGVHIGPGSHLAGTVTVGEGAFLGAGTIVIPDRVIGSWVVVGAGGVVVDDLGDAAVYAGVPARRRRSL